LQLAVPSFASSDLSWAWVRREVKEHAKKSSQEDRDTGLKDSKSLHLEMVRPGSFKPIWRDTGLKKARAKGKMSLELYPLIVFLLE
jgi:hypothetical protein